MNAESLLMIDLEELTWPVTWRFSLLTPWGETQQTLSADVPAFSGSVDHSYKLGRELWLRALAPASVRDVQLYRWDTMCWREGLGSFPMLATAGSGLQDGRGTGRHDTGQFVLHTGHADGYGRRRLPLPALPVSWVDTGRLTRAGWSALLTLAEALNIGMQGLTNAAPYQMLNAYPGVVDRTPLNPNGVAFRQVSVIRVAHYTDRAPEPSSGFE